MRNINSISIMLPEWVSHWKEENGIHLPVKRTHNELMELALSLGIRHLEEKTGGPFAALIYEENECKILSTGLNLVVSHNNSCLHAETTAIMFAQDELKSFSLAEKNANCTLIVTAQPCAMCLGAIPWSGVQTLVYGSPKEDVEKIAGFNEGDIPGDWEEKLMIRGIPVHGPVLADRTRILLEQYARSTAPLY